MIYNSNFFSGNKSIYFICYGAVRVKNFSFFNNIYMASTFYFEDFVISTIASRLRCKIYASIFSWDNLSSKGILITEYLIAFNKIFMVSIIESKIFI